MGKGIWRIEVLKRDNFRCRRCNTKTMNVITISPECDNIYEIRNGLALCTDCINDYSSRYDIKAGWSELEKFLNESGRTLRKAITGVSTVSNDSHSNAKNNIFSAADLNVKTGKQSNRLRDKLESLEKELIKYALSVCPNRNWDYYVTSQNDPKKQWAAIFPMKVENHRKYDDMICNWPNIILDAPTNGDDILLALNLEFKLPRQLLYSHCSTPKSIERLLTIIRGAEGAEISIRKKKIIKDNRLYYWIDELWDATNLPDIKVNQCDSKYLSDLTKLMDYTVPDKDPDIWYEPIFLIKYQTPQSEFLSILDLEGYLGERVSLLSPIIDLLSQDI